MEKASFEKSPGKKRRSIHQVHKWGGHREDVNMLEMWPDLERVGQGTGRVCGNPRLNHECKLGSPQEVSRLH